LDLFFILCKPELAPVRDFQNLVCNNLTAYDHGLGLKKFNHAFRRCLSACASKVVVVPDLAPNETSNPALAAMLRSSVAALIGAKPKKTVRKLSGLFAAPKFVIDQKKATTKIERGFDENIDGNIDGSIDDDGDDDDFGNHPWAPPLQKPPPEVVMERPEYLVRLLRAVCEDGNESAAAQLKQSCGISIGTVCAAIVDHLEACLNKAVKDDNKGALAPRGEDSGDTEPELSPQAILHIMSVPNGVGNSLLALLVELVLMLPLNVSQIDSMEPFLQQCAVPLMEALGRCTTMSAAMAVTCTDIIDLLERVFSSVARLSGFRAENPEIKRIIALVAYDVKSLLEKGQNTPHHLKLAFTDECHRYKVNSLSKTQASTLITRLLQGGVASSFVERVAKETDNSESDIPANLAHAVSQVFNDLDENGDGEMDIYEFVQLYNKVNASGGCSDKNSDATSSFSEAATKPKSKGIKDLKAFTQQHIAAMNTTGHRLTLRTLECAERIGYMSRGEVNLVPQRFTRSGQYETYRRLAKNESTTRKQKLYKRTSADTLNPTAAADSTGSEGKTASSGDDAASKRKWWLFGTSRAQPDMTPVSKGRRKRERTLPNAIKFKHFQDAIHNNPKIIRGLQKRRFTMVTILEKGTPGPHDEHGRNLHLSSNVDEGMPIYRNMSVSSDTTLFGDTDETSSASISGSDITSNNKRGAAGAGRRSSQVLLKASNKVTPFTSAPSLREGRAAASSRNFDSGNGMDGGSGGGGGGGSRPRRGSLLMGGAKRDSKQNTMSGAVPLTWEDVTRRFVRYVTDHFWAPGPGDENTTCTLIFETWNAHLVKARTWALDEEGKKMNIADLQKSASIKLCIPYELTEFERAVFFWKQAELNRMGVTELLATVISNLSHDLTEGGLPDTAIELFNELLNGGNERVQDTLYAHLVTNDTEGKLVAHLAERLEKDMEGIVETRKNAQLGKEGDEENSASDADDCEHAISTVRFLQLLCEGVLYVFDGFMVRTIDKESFAMHKTNVFFFSFLFA
jgi:hypothetical protein